MSFDKGTIHCLLLPNIHPRCSHTLCPQLATFNPAWPHWTQDEQTMKQSHPPTNYSFQSNVRSLRPVLTVEQLLRLGVALPVGGFCCTVNGAAILAAVWPDAGGAGLWLSLAQDGGPGGAIAVADTWLYPAGCWGSSNWEQPAWRKQRLQSVKKRWIKYESAMMEEKISTAFISTNRGINVTYKDCVTWLNKVNTDRSRGRWWCLQVLERAGRGPPAPPWVWWRGSLPALRSRLFLQRWRSCSCGEAWTGTPSAPRRKLSTSPQCRCRDRGQKESRVSAEYVWRTHEQRFEIWPVFTQTSVLTWGRSWCTRCTAAESCGCYKSQFPGFLPRRSLRSWPACGTDCSLPDPWYTLQRRTRGRQIYVMSCCIRGHVSVVGMKVHGTFWTPNCSHSHTVLFLENWN